MCPICVLQKFLEGLNNDIRDIVAAPPNVWSMRRTFTLERMLSGPLSMEAQQAASVQAASLKLVSTLCPVCVWV